MLIIEMQLAARVSEWERKICLAICNAKFLEKLHEEKKCSAAIKENALWKIVNYSFVRFAMQYVR